MPTQPSELQLTDVTRDPETETSGSTGGSQSSNNQVPFLGLSYVIALQGIFPSPNRRLEEDGQDEEYEQQQDSRKLRGAEPILGQIEIFAGNFAPRSWAFCDGQLLAVSSNSALFSLLGTTYGGDGSTTFGLPDLRGRVPMHVGNGLGLANRPLGQKGGSPTSSMSIQNMPAHTHGVDVSKLLSPLSATVSGTNTSMDGESVTLTDTFRDPTLDPLTTDSAGGSQQIDNMAPYLVVTFLIATQGIFPSRNRMLEEDHHRELQQYPNDAYLAEMIMFAGNFAPRGWALCDGQLLAINNNQALYSLMGTTYGGDGRNTFGLPDLRGRIPVHADSDFRLGQKGGSESIQLIEDNLPTHTHSFDVTALGPLTAAAAVLSGDATLDGKNITLDNLTRSPDNVVPTDSTGGGLAADNMMPYQVVNFIIALQGLFPSRNRRLREADERHRQLGTEPFIADVIMFAGNFAPRSWAFCDGQLLPIAQNTALFSLIGTTYGGDGRTTTALPDLRQGRCPMHYGNGPGLPTYQIGERSGSKDTVYAVNQIPAHTHDWDISDLKNITTTLSTQWKRWFSSTFDK
jgi:microcystin-dependent protein